MDRYGVWGIMVEMRDIFTDEKGILHIPMFAAAFMDVLNSTGSSPRISGR